MGWGANGIWGWWENEGGYGVMGGNEMKVGTGIRGGNGDSRGTMEQSVGYTQRLGGKWGWGRTVGQGGGTGVREELKHPGQGGAAAKRKGGYGGRGRVILVMGGSPVMGGGATVPHPLRTWIWPRGSFWGGRGQSPLWGWGGQRGTFP